MLVCLHQEVSSSKKGRSSFRVGGGGGVCGGMVAGSRGGAMCDVRD